LKRKGKAREEKVEQDDAAWAQAWQELGMLRACAVGRKGIYPYLYGKELDD